MHAFRPDSSTARAMLLLDTSLLIERVLALANA
jgi:hypothetical protein